MSYGDAAYYDDYLTSGVIWRRCWAWVVDAVLIGLLIIALAWTLSLVGLITLGLGFGLFAIMPFVPFIYHVWSLVGPNSATPGQRMCGLIVRRNDDMGPPGGLQAVVSVLLYDLTLATAGLLLVVALFTTRHRTLHDILSGLVVVRRGALEALTAPDPSWNTGAYPPRSYPPPAGP